MVIVLLLLNIRDTNAGHPSLHWPRPHTFFCPPPEHELNTFFSPAATEFIHRRLIQA